MLEAVKDYLKGKPAVRRSSKWPAVRKAHLAQHPRCEACGTTKNLNVHHIFPYHLSPEGELTEANLITLCEGSVINCHLYWGHNLNWKSYEPDVRTMAKAALDRLTHRLLIPYRP